MLVPLLVLAFIVVPIAELYVIIKVGEAIGTLPTIGLLLLMGLILVPAGLAVFGWAERRAKHLGLLKRSG